MSIEVIPVEGIPEVCEGDSVGSLIAERAALRNDYVVVISQKVVSKAEGRVRSLAEVQPTKGARELAARVGKKATLVQVILDETRSVLREGRGVLICETHHGFVCANAGIDSSNMPPGTVALLPVDPDRSACRIRAEIRAAAGLAPAVVVADSFGRAWRRGQSEVAIGCAGLEPLDDWRGRSDRGGRRLSATAIAIADEAAAAADLVRDKASGTPVALIRGLGRYVTEGDGPGAAALRRPAEQDLFR